MEESPKNKSIREENIKKLIEKRGVGKVVERMFSTDIISKDKKQSLISIMDGILNFENEGQVGNYVDRIKSEDIEMMQKALQKLLDEQDEKKAPYIFFLGNLISKSKEREHEKGKDKVLSAENVDIKNVIENMPIEGGDLFNESTKKGQEETDFTER